MSQKIKDRKTEIIKQKKSTKSITAPIFYLRNSFQKSMELAIGRKVPKEVAEIIAVDLTPTHIFGDFTFPIFEIAKKLKVDYSKLASDTAENLKSFKKYITGVEIINGYINVTITKEFYTDSIKYILNNNLFQEKNNSKKEQRILLVTEHVKTSSLVNKPVFQFVNNLYGVYPYTVRVVSLYDDVSIQRTKTFLSRIVKSKIIQNLGDNVIAARLPEDKYILLQKQDKTPTPLSHQLASLDIYIKKYKPILVIFCQNSIPQNIYEFINLARALGIFKEGFGITVINNSDIENKINSHHYFNLKKLHLEIGKILQNQDYDPEELIQFEDSEMVAKVISIAPEIIMRSRILISLSRIQVSMKLIMDYTEICVSTASTMYQAYKKSHSTQKTISKKLLLQAVYKILDTSISLIKN